MKAVLPTVLAVALIALCSSLPAGETPTSDEPVVLRPAVYERIEITLPDAIEGRDVTFHLGWHGDAFRQAWGEVENSAKIIDVVDTDSLTYDGGAIKGELRCWVSISGERETRLLRLDLDAAIDGAKVAGSYGGRYSVLTDTRVYDTDEMVVEPDEVSLFHYGQDLKGKARVAVLARPTRDRAHLTIWSRHLLEGHASWTRYVTMEAEVKSGKVKKLSMAPSNSGAGWKPERVEHDLAFDGKALSGTITLKTKGDGGATFGGTYAFTVKATVERGILKGTIKATRNGENYGHDQRLSGVAHADEAKDLDDALVVLTMPQAVEGKRDLRVHVDRKDGEVARALAFVPEYPEQYDVEVADGDSPYPDKLTVAFPANTYMTTKTDPLDVTYALDLESGGKEARGTWQCTFGSYVESGGTLAGRIVDEKDLRREHAIGKGHEWPWWNGPRSSFAANPSGRELVDDLADARVVWLGEDIPPARCQTTRYGEGNINRFIERGGCAGGGCSPVLADGKVYLYYFQPSGGAVGDYVKRMAQEKRHVLRKMWLTKADDVVVCMDAATGKTLWKTTFANQGRYYSYRGTGKSKGAYTSNLAVRDGKVVVHGTSGTTHCLDANTGKRLWSSPQGGGALRVIAGDVVVASGSNVVALDMASGRQRWVVEDAGSRTAIPVRWVHDGTAYLVCGTKGGKLTCIEPATGKVLWQETDTGDHSYSMSLHGDVLVCNGAPYAKRKPMQLAAYRLSTDGAKHLWTVPASKQPYNSYKAPAAAADGHAFVRLSKGNRVYAVDLKTGKIVRDLEAPVGSSGYVFWMDGRLAVQPDASHSRTEFWWFDVSDPASMTRADKLWRARHRTTSSYYPVLMSHALADGRIFIRGQRGIVCYDLRAEASSTDQ